MHRPLLPLVLFVLVVIGAACSPFTIALSSGEPPQSVTNPDPTQSGFQPIPIEHVAVEVGVGSPIPVHIVASGSWPDLCAQIAEIKSEVTEFHVEVSIHSSTADACPPDRLGLPFRVDLPLNIVELEAGSYTVIVNGVAAYFELPPSHE